MGVKNESEWVAGLRRNTQILSSADFLEGLRGKIREESAWGSAEFKKVPAIKCVSARPDPLVSATKEVEEGLIKYLENLTPFPR